VVTETTVPASRGSKAEETTKTATAIASGGASGASVDQARTSSAGMGGASGSGDQSASNGGAASLPVAGDTALASASADAATPALDPEISGAVRMVSPMQIETSIATLAAFTTRNTCSNNTSEGNAIGAARDWIQAQLRAVPGFTVSLESFSFDGCGGGMVSVQNVVAVKLGAHPERVFVIGGHYDSRSVDGTDPMSVSPGANDSGSQTAALIEIARAIAPLELDATIVIAAFAGEEQGLVGSAQLAKEYAMYVVPEATIEAMFNMDIVGGDNTVNDKDTLQQFRLFAAGTPRELNMRLGTTDDTSPARGMMRYVGHWGSAYVPSMTMLPVLREDRPGRGSDQQSFISAGIPAVRFIEAKESENAGTTSSHQHSPNDLPMYVTPSYTARISQIVLAVASSLARAPRAPLIQGATVGPAGAWTVSWSAPSSGPIVDHYVIAARPSTENFYHTRVSVPASSTSQQVSAADLGLPVGSAFFVSVASVDASGHESLFAYPEYRCDTASCSVQSGSLDVTARN
jgi:acetylornithine deacetylase/succinyl-diaminopimelate desuccinylase-like protein